MPDIVITIYSLPRVRMLDVKIDLVSLIELNPRYERFHFDILKVFIQPKLLALTLCVC